MLWTLFAVGFAGLTLGIICTVHVMVLVSIVTVALTAIVAFQTGLSLLMGCAAIGSALVILQACYLVGAFIGASVKSAKDASHAARPFF
jgi:hypothetical protein